MGPIYRFDLQVFRAIHVDLHRSWLDPIFLLFSLSGLGHVQAFGSLLFLLRASTRRYTTPLLLTLFVSGIPVTQGLKHVVSRERPSNLVFATPQEDWLYNSFPSGHTTTSFALAFMLLFLTWRRDHFWIGKAALVWALLVGVSRIYRGVHWPTDVIAGIFGGLFSAALVFLVLSLLGKWVDDPGRDDAAPDHGGGDEED